jgi:hypothetical protein
MQVSSAVWSEVARLDGEPEITLFVAGDSSEARELAVEAAIGRASERVRENLGLPELASVGRCRTLALPTGVAINITEDPPDLDGLIRAIALELGLGGIRGTLGLSPEDEPEAVRSLRSAREFLLPPVLPLIECRVRLRGASYQAGAGGHRRWRATPAALDAATRSAIAFCYGPNAQDRILFAELRHSRFRRDDEPRPYVERALRKEGGGVVHLIAQSDGLYRAAGFDVAGGRLTLFEGGDEVADGWRMTTARLRDQLIALAPSAVYGFIKRGNFSGQALLGGSLMYDWPAMPGSSMAARQTGEVLEYAFAPDAFGIQLLGPDYSGRIPAFPDWVTTPLGNGAVLLESSNPEAWFEAATPSGRTLETARRELHELIATDEQIHNARFGLTSGP